MPHAQRFCYNSVHFSMPNGLLVFISASQTTPGGAAGNNRRLFGPSLAFRGLCGKEHCPAGRGIGVVGTVDCLENPLSRWLAHVAGSLLHPPRRLVQEAVWVSSQRGIRVSRGRKQKPPVLLRMGPRVAECCSCLVLGPAHTHRIGSGMPATSP